jgi:Uma2 family endonuclease
MSTQPKTQLTPEQYLEIERKSEFRSEYYNGEMFAMPGSSEEHNVLIGNLFTILRPQLRSRNCRVYFAEMRVRVGATGLYTYPDLAAVCGERKFADADVDTLLNPTLIAEVLSPSTEAYDRGRKFEQYRQIESLREYILVAQDRIHVDLYTKRDDGLWLLASVSRLEDTLQLSCAAANVSLSELYADIDLLRDISSE